MKKFELVFGVILIALISLKFLHLEGSSFLLVIGMTILSTTYLIFGFLILNEISIAKIFKKTAYKNVNSFRIIGSVLLGWLISFLLTGILFKLQLWDGGDFMLNTGLTWIVISTFLISLIYWKKKKFYFVKHIVRILSIGIVVLILYLIPKSKLVEIYYRDNPDYVKLYKDVLANPDDQELKENWIKETRKMYEK